MDSFEMQLVDAVRRKREAEGLSIRALSAVVGISFSTLARIERGDGLPDNNSKIRLLEWLDADAGEAGLTFDNVAFVHFRAAKNVRSSRRDGFPPSASQVAPSTASVFPSRSLPPMTVLVIAAVGVTPAGAFQGPFSGSVNASTTDGTFAIDPR
jgi:transcriptional regulator with XRE-family HTH domain